MTTEWHAEYLALENAEGAAREAYRVANKAANYVGMGPKWTALQAARDTALEAFRAAGKARWDFEMAGGSSVDIATLPTAEWAQALR